MNRLLKYALAVPAFILLPAAVLRADETVGSPKFVERFLDGGAEKADSVAAVSSQASLTLESIVEQACRGGIFIIRQAFDAVDAATMQSVESWEQSPRIQGCIAVMAGEIRLIDNIRIK